MIVCVSQGVVSFRLHCQVYSYLLCVMLVLLLWFDVLIEEHKELNDMSLVNPLKKSHWLPNANSTVPEDADEIK